LKGGFQVITEKDLRNEISKPERELSQKIDTSLLSLLWDLNDRGQLKIILGHFPKSAAPQAFSSDDSFHSKLLEWFNNHVNGLGNAHHQPYNIDTCFEFHQILISTLIGYRKKAGHLKKCVQDKTGDRNLAATHFLTYSRLLWEIAYSKMFIDHLLVLQDLGRLSLPCYDHSKIYLRYRMLDEDLASLDDESEDAKRWLWRIQ
jgi:hypothetical protein